MIREQIEEKLRLAFNPFHLEVNDESYKHNVPAGSESHFKVIIVSDFFKGERFLIRHRAIYSELTIELSKIHALALHTYTLKEWSVLQYAVPNSPCCNSKKTQQLA
ncbi:BolA family transcriptional regulator [Candidatus Pantoea edessiphila]|uniref:DNA-binding transcriptional regulator BolA n=2 Tax=Candidatus Pantoea edessiphila TaxID=2044610 RepID=A0A2P5SXF0_9GAMM|nr:transcriptional regulator BolA [Pantoea sp. Edef]PPI87018.1 BolA family transcriptional regulator [Candidatus Pantoea edessiphila]